MRAPVLIHRGRRGRFQFALLACWALAASGLSAHAADIAVRDDSGVLQHWSKPPQRIVSLMPSLTESVCALGACDRLVGVDRFSNYPPQVQRLPKLGGLEDSSVEAIVALHPDVVLLSPSLRCQDRLRALGLKVVVLETRSSADVRKVLQQLGTLLQRPDPQAVWRDIDAQIARAAASLPAAVRGLRVYEEIDATPYAAGEASFLGETLQRLGLRNIVGPQMGPFPRLNPEFVVRADPQLMVVPQRGLPGLAQRPGWSHISAIRHQALCVLTAEESEVITRPGPRMALGAITFARCLRQLSPRQLQAMRGEDATP